jgi:type IV secretory pathway TrbD component
MVDMSAYKKPVHRSLLQRELIGGIPQVGLFLLFFLGIIFAYGMRQYWTIVPIVLIFFLMRHFTKKDPWFIEILLENITQKDKLIP